jgi:cytoskeletal protein CcmA (bactofilin family)
MPTTPRTPDLPSAKPPATDSQQSARTLTVGRGLVLSGTIQACDVLIVEGTITADIAGCRELRVAAGGLFTGSASVESADIAGRFEGKLEVNGRLSIRDGGRVNATVRYREIEVQCGGQIGGSIERQA